jgi:putative transposase
MGAWEWPQHQSFAWQLGYGAFSVSKSNVPEVTEYIRKQEEHHRRFTYQEEFLAFLRQHGLEYDERYIWD